MARAWVLGDDVDTDAMAPGRLMHRPLNELAAQSLVDLRADFTDAAPGDVIVAGRNFGTGSSREQAVEALLHRGIAGVVARSFAGIFYRNAINLGLPVLVGDTRAIPDGAEVTLDVGTGRLRHPGGEIELEPIPDFLLELIRDGGLVAHLEKRFAAKPTGGMGR